MYAKMSILGLLSTGISIGQISSIVVYKLANRFMWISSIFIFVRSCAMDCNDPEYFPFFKLVIPPDLTVFRLKRASVQNPGILHDQCHYHAL